MYRGSLTQRLLKGWAHTDAGELTDAQVTSMKCIVRRGLMYDTILTEEEVKAEQARRMESMARNRRKTNNARTNE